VLRLSWAAACEREPFSDVAGDELPREGVIEGGSHEDVDLEDRLGSQAGPGTSAGGGERFVEVVEVLGAQPAEADVADRWGDVAVDERGVAVGGGWTDLAPLVRQPGLGEELGDRDGPASGRRLRPLLTIQTSGDRFRLGAIVPHRAPPPSFPAGEGVEPVVGDNVEAISALDDVGHVRER